MKKFKCLQCGKIYDEDQLPGDWMCRIPPCDGVHSVIIPEDEDEPFNEAGLCVLLMDASGSMSERAFSQDYPYPYKYGTEFLTKREVVTDNAAFAIFELGKMANKEHAYICAVKFDTSQKVIFTKSVSTIIEEYKSPQLLAEFLYNELFQMKGGTNITSALNMAYNLSKQFLDGEIQDIGNYTPMKHTQFNVKKDGLVDIPNMRTLIYSDGEHLADYGPLINPFQQMETDLLLAAYIGQAGEKGCNDLRKIVGRCPIHDKDQFFVIDSATKIATLRGLFRMASGTSGFCQACLGNATQL